MKVEVLCEGKVRVDSYLSSELDISRSKIQKLIEQEKILVNGKVINSNYKVKSSDIIEVNDELDFTISVEAEDIAINVVYEDDDLMVINKESGMVVHPAPGHYSGTLVNALLFRNSVKSTDKIRPGIVHRLDKDTSGLMVVAKNDWALEKLSEMMKNKEVERHYIALVYGVINHDTGTIDAPIGRDANNRQKMDVTEVNGRDAITHFKVLENYKDTTLVECKLETGRTHQIRVHMAYIGHPVVNDPLYSNKKSDEYGQMLYSKSIKFIHPRTNKEIFYEIDMPKEFRERLDNFIDSSI